MQVPAAEIGVKLRPASAQRSVRRQRALLGLPLLLLSFKRRTRGLDQGLTFPWLAGEANGQNAHGLVRYISAAKLAIR